MAKGHLPEKIQQAIKAAGVVEVGPEVTSEQVDNLGRLQGIQERAKHHRTIVTAGTEKVSIHFTLASVK